MQGSGREEELTFVAKLVAGIVGFATRSDVLAGTTEGGFNHCRRCSDGDDGEELHSAM